MVFSRTQVVCSAVALVAVFSATASAQILKGSPESVQRMYSHASSNGYTFFRNRAAVDSAVRQGKLVKLVATKYMELHDVSYPYVQSEVKLFVERLSQQYFDKCGETLVVTGATRPLNMNARLANASDNSVHPTGMAIDLRRSKSSKCVSWLRSTLSSLELRGVLEATEEKNPVHFHVAVFPKPYVGYVALLTSPDAMSEAREAVGAEPSQEIQLVSYSVRNGDSLWLIARKHDVSVKSLQELNSLRSATIHPGQVIIVPAVLTPR